MLPPHLAEMFYQLFDKKLSFNEFADKLYATESEIELYMNPEDYLELISFNFRKSYAMHDLYKLMVKYINIGEQEKRRLLSYLYDVREKTPTTADSLEILYSQYCKGYYFLQEIAIGYGLCVIVAHDKGSWDNLAAQEQLLGGFYPSLTTEADLVISMLENGVVVLSGEKGEDGCYVYSDNTS